MKQIIFSTLHDPEGKLDLIQEIINQNVPGRLVKDYEKWVVAVSKATYVGKGKELIDKLRKLKGVDVVIEAGGEFCENASRNNHYLGLRRASELAKELGVGYCFYADADRVLCELARNYSGFETLSKGMGIFLSQPEGSDVGMISVCRSMYLESIPRNLTEIPLNDLISMMVEVKVDPLGSYLMMSVNLMDKILTYSKKRENGLSFPATEWMITAMELESRIVGWSPRGPFGGYEFDNDYTSLNPWVIRRRALDGLIRNWGKPDSHYTPLDINSRKERDMRFGSVLTGSLDWMNIQSDDQFAIVLHRVSADIGEWRKRTVNAESILKFLEMEISEGRLRSKNSKEILILANQFGDRIDQLSQDLAQREKDKLELGDKWIGDECDSFITFRKEYIKRRENDYLMDRFNFDEQFQDHHPLFDRELGTVLLGRDERGGRKSWGIYTDDVPEGVKRSFDGILDVVDIIETKLGSRKPLGPGGGQERE